jgi:dTDP-4-dehydrorhamnose 3,5-epimerase-like enzyme
MWDDKDLNINWPVKKPKISFKDKNLLTYKNFLKKFKHL